MSTPPAGPGRNNTTDSKTVTDTVVGEEGLVGCPGEGWARRAGRLTAWAASLLPFFCCAAALRVMHTLLLLLPLAAGEHTHTIVGYSLIKGIGDGEPIASERFTVGGHEWVSPGLGGHALSSAMLPAPVGAAWALGLAPQQVDHQHATALSHPHSAACGWRLGRVGTTAAPQC
jgi:hypothetical protein